MAVSTPRARRMLEALPAYYWGNDLAERAVQAIANELDRVEARAEAVRRGLIPWLADDEHGMLSRWEEALKLPIRPPDATLAQRQAKVQARFQAIGDSSAKATIAALRTAARTENVTVLRNTPSLGTDTIEVPFEPGSYNAAQVEALAVLLWPAHRGLAMRYSSGFLLDLSRLDSDLL